MSSRIFDIYLLLMQSDSHVTIKIQIRVPLFLRLEQDIVLIMMIQMNQSSLTRLIDTVLSVKMAPSVNHNVRLRALAKKKGYRVNEHGIFLREGGKRVGGEKEEDLYRLLGIEYVPPTERSE